MLDKVTFSEGMRIFLRRRLQKTHHRFNGEPREILHSVAKNNWNGKFFQASHGNFKSFYIRDFGMSVEGLIYMGYTKQVYDTLEFAMNTYVKHNKITTTITADGIPIDLFDYGVDSIPYLIRSIRISRAFYLARKHADFLNEKIQEYYKIVFNSDMDLVYLKKKFSTMKDNHNRKSSMYSNCCVAMLSMELEKLKESKVILQNPFKKWNPKKTLKDRFWVGTHFLDDISDEHYIAADANIMPFLFEIFTDKTMAETALNTIVSQGLDSPLPAKYTSEPIKKKENKLLSIFAKNYQGNTCWTNVGVLLMQVAANVNKVLLRKYMDIYLEMLEEHRNFLELFNPDGSMYKTPFYMYDEGMLWSAVFYKVLEEYYQPLKHYKIK
ncbi:MAG: hypothetical protein ACLFSL_01595 [Candidatus Woesearchaeota archaeon]